MTTTKACGTLEQDSVMWLPVARQRGMGTAGAGLEQRDHTVVRSAAEQGKNQRL